jgi:pimeloyl-ACP methyl ester carboxylesterase
MPRPDVERPGRPHLARDSQQWIFDYIIQETGRVFHWWSDGGRALPKSVRSHAMISKHVGRQAQRIEAFAAAEAAAGHRRTALDLYFQAAMGFMRAQHPIFENNAEKLHLYEGLRRTYDQVAALSPYRIERIDVEWEGNVISGWLHLHPELARAPLLYYLTGCDITCESWPNPMANEGHERGMHVFSFDGPGQGQSNIRGIRLTADNYGRAARTMLDHLVTRPEIDAERIGLFGVGAGSLWGLRYAADEPRLKAMAASSTYADLYYLMNEDGPRWKQLFGYLTQSTTEEELDAVLAEMGVRGYVGRIKAPTLMLSGEYDHRDPPDEVFEVFEELTAPGELWMFADLFHNLSFTAGGTPLVHAAMIDWIRDRLDGKPVPHPGQVVYIEPGSAGPNAPDVPLKRRWYEPSARME